MRTSDFVEGTSAREYKEKQVFLWYFARLFDKFFTFEKINTFIFFSLNQNFRTFVTDFDKINRSDDEESAYNRQIHGICTT